MEIDIKEYLSYSDLKEIAREQMSVLVAAHLKDEEAVKRIISNTAYELIYKMVDDVLDSKLEELLRDKVAELVSSMTTYNIFNKPDAWSRETNTAYDILRKAVLDNEKRIQGIVSDNIDRQALAIMKEDIREIVRDKVLEYYHSEVL